MSAPKERIAEILRAPEGERIYLSLVDYAEMLAKRYGWRTGRILPQGSSPEAIVGDVIVKVLEGKRTWDEAKEPSLLNALKGMVRSELGHLFDELETQLVEPIAKTLPDGSERTADDFASRRLNPEQTVLRSESTQLEMAALQLIFKEVEGNSELESVFLALYETDSAEEVAKLTGIPIERVYSLRRELKRIAARITPERVIRAAQERRRT